MKLVNQSYTILGTPHSLEEAWAFVAKAARNCYQSEKTKMDETEEEFCKRILLRYDDFEKNHMSPFEFGIIYLTVPYEHDLSEDNNHSILGLADYKINPYSRWILCGYNIYITTNLRVILENGWEDDLKYAGAPTQYHIKACMFNLITSMHVYKDLTRHRTLSFAIESTRFCRYTSEKFGSGLTFIRPPRLKSYTDDELCLNEEGIWSEHYYNFTLPKRKMEATVILHGLANCEKAYSTLIKECGWTAQDAAAVLPQDLKASVMVCGYEDNLAHMFNLRALECSGPVLPQLKEIMEPLYKDYVEYIKK